MMTDAWPRSKVTAPHRANLASVSVRPSSLTQVRQHGESTDLQ